MNNTNPAVFVRRAVRLIEQGSWHFWSIAPLGGGVGAEDNRRVLAAIRPPNWYVPAMSLRAVTLSVVVSAVLAACGSSGGGAATLSVERWASPNPGSVNAYWIEGPDGIVVIDAGRNVSGGQKI